MSKIMRVAVIGGGVSGLAAAYVLAKEGVEVVVYEKECSLGGQAKTTIVGGIPLDLGFMVFSSATYPDVMELFESLGVDMEVSDKSFSVSLDEGRGPEWGSRHGLSSLLGQMKNAVSPWFWKMMSEIATFKNDASSYLENHPETGRNETLRDFILSRGYSELFQKAFLIPLCATIWPYSSAVMAFSASLALSFLCNSGALELLRYSQRSTPRWRSQSYVSKIMRELEIRGCQVKTNSEIYSVSSNEEGCNITCCDGLEEAYDGCVIATHAPNALKILGKQATYDELRILGAFRYAYSDVFLHHDDNLMPKNRATWASTNVLGSTKDKIYKTTYWLNNVQNNINEHELPFLLTLNPTKSPKDILYKWSTSHPIPSVAASKASSELGLIQGKRRLWLCGAYQGCGLPEDGVKAGILAANNLLRKRCTVQHNPINFVPSWFESGTRIIVTSFLERFIATGCVMLQEREK